MADVQTPPADVQQDESPRLVARFIPWLIMLAIAMIFLPIYLTSATLQDMTEPLQTESVSLQETVTAPPSMPVAEQTLTAHLLDLSGQLAALAKVPPTLSAAHVDWPAIMANIHSYDANQIRLTGFDHANGSLTLQGEALQESAVIDYAHALEQTGFFSAVRVQSITVNPVPLPTPDLIATPGLEAPVMTKLYMPFVFTISVSLTEAGNGSL